MDPSVRRGLGRFQAPSEVPGRELPPGHPEGTQEVPEQEAHQINAAKRKTPGENQDPTG